MSIPSSQLQCALIVFMLTPDGEVVTVGGRRFELGNVASEVWRDAQTLQVHKHSDGAGIGASGIGASGIGPSGIARPSAERVQRRFLDALCDTDLNEIPRDAISSRVRPLLPRVVDSARILLPLWTTGCAWRTVDEGRRRASMPRAFEMRGALERLAVEIGDPSLVQEAESEFRRALAADPMAHQMVSDSARLRVIATGELARDVHCERPPMLALLPECFTIDQLRIAVSQAARAPGAEIESSSNFRRRVTEFVDAGVLVDIGGAPDFEQRGRPPRLYRFDSTRWWHWLSRRANGEAIRPEGEQRIREKAEQQEEMHGVPASERFSKHDVPAESRRDASLESRVGTSPETIGRGQQASPRVLRRAEAREVRLASQSDAELRRVVELRQRIAANQESVVAYRSHASRTSRKELDPARVEQLEQMVAQLSGEVQASREQTSQLMRLMYEKLQERRGIGDGRDHPQDQAQNHGSDAQA